MNTKIEEKLQTVEEVTEALNRLGARIDTRTLKEINAMKDFAEKHYTGEKVTKRDSEEGNEKAVAEKIINRFERIKNVLSTKDAQEDTKAFKKWCEVAFSPNEEVDEEKLPMFFKEEDRYANHEELRAYMCDNLTLDEQKEAGLAEEDDR